MKDLSATEKNLIKKLAAKSQRILSLQEIIDSFWPGNIGLQYSTFQQTATFHFDKQLSEEQQNTSLQKRMFWLLEIINGLKYLEQQGYLYSLPELPLEDNTQLLGNKPEPENETVYNFPDLNILREFLLAAGKKYKAQPSIKRLVMNNFKSQEAALLQKLIDRVTVGLLIIIILIIVQLVIVNV